MEWRVVPFGSRVVCGRCETWLVSDQPYALVTKARLVRCRACAPGPVDEAAIDRERHRLEELSRRAPEGVPQRPAVRLPRPRGLTPAREIAGTVFDPKLAAAGRDD